MKTVRWVRAAALVFCAAVPARAAETSLTLDEAVAIALRGNPALAAAEGREAGAWAALERTGAERWPQLRLESRVGHLSEVPATRLPGLPPVPLAEKDTWVTSATLQQLVFSGGRVSALVRQAGRGAEAARELTGRARQLTAFAAERAFRLLVAAQEETGVAAKNLVAAEDHLRVANERLAARVAARYDVLRAEVQAEEARQEVIRADGGLLAARAGLLQALGLADGEFRAVSPGAAAPGAPQRPLESLVADAARLRPDLRALERQVAAAEEGVRAARAECAPTLGLSADYQLVTPESTTVFSRWFAGASVSLPLLDGGRARARRAESQAALAQARAALEAGRRQVETEVRQAAARAAAAQAQVAVAARRLEQAEELCRLADVRFSGGVGTATEIADARASLERARFGLVRAEADQGVTAAEVALAVGSIDAQAPAAAAVPRATKEGSR